MHNTAILLILVLSFSQFSNAASSKMMKGQNQFSEKRETAISPSQSHVNTAHFERDRFLTHMSASAIAAIAAGAIVLYAKWAFRESTHSRAPNTSGSDAGDRDGSDQAYETSSNYGSSPNSPISLSSDNGSGAGAGGNGDDGKDDYEDKRQSFHTEPDSNSDSDEEEENEEAPIESIRRSHLLGYPEMTYDIISQHIGESRWNRLSISSEDLERHIFLCLAYLNRLRSGTRAHLSIFYTRDYDLATRQLRILQRRPHNSLTQRTFTKTFGRLKGNTLELDAVIQLLESGEDYYNYLQRPNQQGQHLGYRTDEHGLNYKLTELSAEGYRCFWNGAALNPGQTLNRLIAAVETSPRVVHYMANQIMDSFTREQHDHDGILFRARAELEGRVLELANDYAELRTLLRTQTVRLRMEAIARDPDVQRFYISRVLGRVDEQGQGFAIDFAANPYGDDHIHTAMAAILQTENIAITIYTQTPGATRPNQIRTVYQYTAVRHDTPARQVHLLHEGIHFRLLTPQTHEALLEATDGKEALVIDLTNGTADEPDKD